MSEEFEYVVTPLSFDLSLELDAEGYDVRKVYGSTAAEEAGSEIVHVNTLFASPTKVGKTRGGIVLVQVERQSADATMTLKVSWEDRAGNRGETSTTISFPDAEPEQFANTGVRKAVLLSRYADLLKNWMVAERDRDAIPTDEGIAVPPEGEGLGEWEQRSEPLTVSERYATRIEAFRDYFAGEIYAVGDDLLGRELELVDRILAASE